MSGPLFKRGLLTKLSNLPIEDGSIIFSYDNLGNPSTLYLDLNINGNLKRLNISSGTASTADYAKNSKALEGSSLSQIINLVTNKEAFIKLNTSTDNTILLTRVNGQVVQKIIDNVSNASSSSISSTSLISQNSNSLLGCTFSTLSIGTSATFSNKIPFISKDSIIEIGLKIDFHGDSNSRDYTIRLDSSIPNNLNVLGIGSLASTVTASYFNGTSKNSEALQGSSLLDILNSFETNDEYLSILGGEMLGLLSLLSNLNIDNYSGALNGNNSNIYGLSGIYFNALSNGISNAINFYRDYDHVDSLWSKNGILFFTPNRSFGKSSTSNIILHSGNINEYSASVSHTHGLASSSLITNVISTDSGGWNIVDNSIGQNNTPTGFSLKTIKTSSSTPDWLYPNASGILFGGDSFRTVITAPYLNPAIKIASGNESEPRWYFSITGTNANIYDLDSFVTQSGLENINADSATRIVSSNKSIINNFTIRTGIPLSSGWNNYPIWQIVNTSKPELIDYKNKNLSILHMDGGLLRHDIVALNEPNSGLIYATSTTATGSSSRIERILDSGNYGNLISDLNKHVVLNDGFRAQTNVELDGGNFISGDLVSGDDTTQDDLQKEIKIFVSGNKLIIKTK